MGYKEVMALRQEGDLESAVKLAREDYKESPNQWSSSALFWVLKDVATGVIEGGEIDTAAEMVAEMETLIEGMGATAPMAEESLASLRQSVVPHFGELNELLTGYQTEKNPYHRRDQVRQTFDKVLSWHNSKEGLHKALHPRVAQVVSDFFESRNKFITIEEVRQALRIYLSLEIERPSALNSRVLDQVLRVKSLFRERLDFTDFLTKWDPAKSLRPEDWQRGSGKGRKDRGPETPSLVDRALTVAIEELMDRRETKVPEMIYELFTGLESLYPDDRLVKLTQARLHLLEGERATALEEYQRVLMIYSEPRIWGELASLLSDDPALEAAALAKALKEETDDYEPYLLTVRLHYAKLLIDRGDYDKALRELRIIAQIAGERGRKLPQSYEKMQEMIPEGTEEDKENKAHYILDAQPAEAYVYRSLAATPMIVMDVIALRLKEPMRQVVPMLKLSSPEGRVLLTNPTEMGLPEGDLRGKLFDVKFIEPEDSHAIVVHMEPSEADPRDLFPLRVAYITGYSQGMHAFHLIDSESKHHYLPGEEEDFMIGDFVNFILLYDTIRKPTPKRPAQQRALLLAPHRIDPEEALADFPLVPARVISTEESRVTIETDEGVTGTFSQSLAPIELSEGDSCTLRGFVFRKRDRFTGEQRSYFVTLSVEPLPTDQLG
ncbi:hypothetical protein [uncultured Porphyromonas sp.]|uniref:DUF7017 domain-containing protein n=1 Tax=uncultured Porphyromonas sp. TaxID=159274 RepID=UPI00263357FA|nr:hypothetical protein [uncultured Porphyromonas sp.]